MVAAEQAVEEDTGAIDAKHTFVLYAIPVVQHQFENFITSTMVQMSK